MLRLPRPLAAAIACSLVSLAATAGAQTKAERYSYQFDDDFMLGDTLSSPPPVIVVRRPVARIMLLRARATFGTEMLKSVDDL